MTLNYLCICSEEMCFCANAVEMPEESCELCEEGHHVWLPGGPRE